MKIKFTLLLILLFSCNAVITQAQSDKKVAKILAKSNKLIKASKTDEANQWLEKNINEYPANEKLLTALVTNYLNNEQFEKAEPHLKTLKNISNPPNSRVHFTYYNSLKQQKKYEEATSEIKEFLGYQNQGSKSHELGLAELKQLNTIDSLLNNQVDIPFDNIGQNINTINAENLPFFTADGKILFSRIVNGQEDLFISTLTDTGFIEAQPLVNLNTPANEGAQCISPDGNFIFFTGCERRDGYGRCDIYVSVKKQDGWSQPKNLGSNINSEARETQPCISADGKTLFFSSNRKGGYGKSDLYRSTYVNNGWTTPVNLGDKINSKGEEESPYIHPDGNSLYFISSGHPGMGGKDIFYSHFKDGQWETPKNLGYPINQEGDEYGLFVDINGNSGYFASDSYDDSYGLLDIYSFPLPEAYKPDPISFVKVIVRDAETKKLISATSSLIDLEDGRKLQKTTNLEGESIQLVNPKKEYSLTVRHDGYIFHSENIQFEEIAKSYEPFTYEIFLQKVEVPTESEPTETSDPIVLNNIFFESGSFELLEKSNFEIKSIASFMKENEKVRIQFVGHTDNVGQENDNLALSEKRALAVKNALVAKGIESERMTGIGKGETQPIDSNETESGRKNNRRTEMIIQYE